MNSESKSKFNLWLSEHPESFLPSDEARMFDFVNSLHGTEGNICFIKFSVASQGELHLDPSFLLRRKNVTVLRCSEPLRSKVGEASKPCTQLCGMGPPGE